MSAGLKALLERLGVQPNKALGQNFLTDPAAAAAIVADLGAGPDDVVVEVGPGTGALSEHLAGNVRKLVLVEFDQKLAGYLRERFAGEGGVEVVHADAARHDLRPLYAEGPVKFIGNLPYSSGGAIMKRFLDPPTPVAEAVLMLQREVAERLLARPRSKSYGPLTLRVGAWWDVEMVRTLPPEPFHPRPKVDSSVVRLRRRDAGGVAPFDWRTFDRLVRVGFGERRKQMGRRLPLEGRGWGDLCEELALSPTARAEELSLADWMALARAVDPHPLKDLPQRAEEIFDVVDDRDEVVGQATRAEVHAGKLKHRAVHLFVLNRRGEVFLQKRSRLKDTAPGRWDSSAAGHLDAGEAYATCAERELGEELGVEAAVEEVGRIAPCEGTGWEFVRLYRAEHRGPFRWPASEIETGEFFSEEVIDKWVAGRPGDFATGFLECWKLWKAR